MGHGMLLLICMGGNARVEKHLARTPCQMLDQLMPFDSLVQFPKENVVILVVAVIANSSIGCSSYFAHDLKSSDVSKNIINHQPPIPRTASKTLLPPDTLYIWKLKCHLWLNVFHLHISCTAICSRKNHDLFSLPLL